MAKAMDLIFSLFNVASAFWHTALHTMHSSWTYQYLPLYELHSSLFTMKMDLVVVNDCITESLIFHSGYFDNRGAF